MLFMGLALAACGQDEAPSQRAGEDQAAASRKMKVMEVQRQNIPLDKSYPAKLRSDDEVVLKARVIGTLEQRHFEPGEMVEVGQLLYSIEPDVYLAAVNQREADLHSARAELTRAQRDAERFERLLSQSSVSRQQVDQARAELGVARAAVAQTEAALARARIDLDYAEVTAPVAGMISLSQVNVGNLVVNDPATELATITPLDPLEVRFQMPQKDAFALRRQLADQPDARIQAVLNLPEQGERLEGRLDYLGSRVDDGTSTVQARATFANPDAKVLPGQFVRVSLVGLQRFDVIAVPEIATTQGLMGPQVFVLDEESRARARTVQLGELAGPWQLLEDGLDPGDRVVVGDPADLEPGTPIEPQPFDGDAEALMPEGSPQGRQTAVEPDAKPAAEVARAAGDAGS